MKQMQIDSIMDLNEKLPADKLEEDHLRGFCKEAGRAFLDQFGLISHQINSYNEFIDNGVQKVIDSLRVVNVEPGYDPSKKGVWGWRHAKVTFGKVKLESPTFWTGSRDGKEEILKLYPKHARLQNMTYSSKMIVDVKVQVYTQELKSDKSKTGKEQCMNRRVLKEATAEIVIGSLPVMVKSKLCWLHKLEKSDCPFDIGGYFLIKGMEKVFIAQERRCLSRLWVTNKPCWTVQYQSQSKQNRIYVQLKESSKASGFCGSKVITVCFLYATMPIWILFFALGASSDKEILQMINIDESDAGLINVLLSTIKEADKLCEGFRNREKAIQFIDEQVKATKFPPSESIEECFTSYLFPNMDGHKIKSFFLGYMVKGLLLAWSGKRKCDNIHDFRNKRLELAGDLLARELSIQIRHAQRRMVKAMQRDLSGDRELQVEVVERYLDASIITNALCRAFATGAWSHPYKRMETSTGIVANLRRVNPVQMISDLRKTRQQVQYSGKSGDARYPNPSYWGKLCFLSTPDGENCGLVKNLAATGIVSNNRTESILETLMSCGMEKLEDIPLPSLHGMSKVLINGAWVGSCEDGGSFVTKLKSLRRGRVIHLEVEIKWDQQQQEVRIFSDAGRIMRPLLIVDNLHKARKFSGGCHSFQSLLDEQIIEIVGVEEEEDCQTAWGVNYLFKGDGEPSPKYTHCELDVSFLLGLSCGIIPFANHNFARRVLFQSEKHSQQAIGFSTANPTIRVDTMSYQLFYPQTPLFRTMISECLGKSSFSISKPELFNGQNAIVAVNVHQGYNQEDSLVMNRASLERGMFRTELFRCYKSVVDNKDLTRRLKPKDRVDFGKVESKIGSADSLDDDGFPCIAASLQSGDLVIGKVAEESGADHSIKLKHTEKGMVQKVVLSANDDGKNFAVVTLRQVRSPCLGDKFSSMHGQKGVVGFLEAQENFPFTCQGIVPDIVINPHAFPTRQTPGQLLEAALGKGIACGGPVRYATPFTTPSVDVIADQLHRAGYQRWGAERVSNGRTGEMMHCLIFMGPTFYQRLIHMAEDKVKFRNTGPVHPLTRQPVADRKRFGGVRFGEMERDCLLAHGAAANLHERLFTLSDSSQMHICQTCTRVANVIQRPVPGGKKVRGPYCPFCQSSENIVKINVPYGAKLLYQELFSMGICLKFTTEVS